MTSLCFCFTAHHNSFFNSDTDEWEKVRTASLGDWIFRPNERCDVDNVGDFEIVRLQNAVLDLPVSFWCWSKSEGSSDGPDDIKNNGEKKPVDEFVTTEGQGVLLSGKL